jgi:hypothetical protein
VCDDASTYSFAVKRYLLYCAAGLALIVGFWLAVVALHPAPRRLVIYGPGIPPLDQKIPLRVGLAASAALLAVGFVLLARRLPRGTA